MMKRSLSREFASKVVQRSKMHRDSSYDDDDDDANELPVVAGWSDRVRVEHYSGIW